MHLSIWHAAILYKPLSYLATSMMVIRAISSLGLPLHQALLVSPIVGVSTTVNQVKLTMPAMVPATEDWLKVLAGPELN
jgi:hypothetical protein